MSAQGSGTGGLQGRDTTRFIWLVFYASVFVGLFFLLYIAPELSLFRADAGGRGGSVADVPSGPVGLGAILRDLWRERGTVLNPFENPVVRFFLVTTVVGAVLDQVKRYAKTRE